VVTFGTAGVDRGTSIAPLPDGSLFLAAYATLAGGHDLDGVLMHVDRPKWPRKPAGFVTHPIPLG
jgi:hypothetical protein